MIADSPVVATLKEGEAVTIDWVVSASDGAWCAVRRPDEADILGYVRCRHLRRETGASPERAFEQIDEMLELAGVRRAIIQATDKSNLRFFWDKTRIDERDAAIWKVLTESLQPDAFYLPVRRYFQKTYSAKHVAFLLEWLRTPLLQKMTELELRASSADALHELVSFSAQLRNNPASPRRLRLLGRLEDATNNAACEIEAAVARFRGVVNAINPTLSLANRVREEDLEELANQMRAHGLAEAKKADEVRWLYAYRGVPDGELEEYVQFWESDAGMWFSRRLCEAVSEAVQEYSERTVRQLSPLLAQTPGRDLTTPLAAESAEESYEQGVRLLDAGDLMESIQYFDWAIRLKPTYAIAYYKRGNAYRRLGQLQRAIAEYSEAIRLDPGMSLAYNNRGITYVDLGQAGQAIEDFSAAIKADPENTMPYYNRGREYAKLGQHQRAIVDFSEAIRLDPSSACHFNNRGHSFGRLGQWEQAAQDCSVAIELDPRTSDSYACRGWAYNNLGRYQQALRDYSEAVRLNPKDAASFRERGLAFAELGQPQRAFADFETAIRLNPRDPKAYTHRGAARQRLGDLTGALSDYGTALEIDPNFAWAYGNRAALLAHLGRRAEAERDFQKCIALDGSLRSVFEPMVRGAHRRRGP